MTGEFSAEIVNERPTVVKLSGGSQAWDRLDIARLYRTAS